MGNITPWLAAATPPSAVSHTAKSCLGFSVHICKTSSAAGWEGAWSLLTFWLFSPEMSGDSLTQGKSGMDEVTFIVFLWYLFCVSLKFLCWVFNRLQQSCFSLKLFLRVVWSILVWAHLYQNCLRGNPRPLGWRVPVDQYRLCFYKRPQCGYHGPGPISILMFSSIMCRVYFWTPNSCSTWPWDFWFLMGAFSHSQLRVETSFLASTLGWRGKIL